MNPRISAASPVQGLAEVSLPLWGPVRPAEECPYSKPFPPDFVDCPAYQATQMVTVDLSHRPLGSVITCRHLESRLMPNTNYRWYGACALGDADARRSQTRWRALSSCKLWSMNS